MESEFIALDKAGEEAERLRNFLEDILNWSRHLHAICIHCDSQSAFRRAQSHMYNGKSRHIQRIILLLDNCSQTELYPLTM